MAIVTILAGCANTLPSAEPTSTIMDGADKIYLVTDQEPDQAYKSIAGYLSGKGFGFENTDAALRLLKTDHKENDGSLDYSYSLNVSIRSDSSTVILISGSGQSSLGTFEIRNRGMKGSLINDSWQKMLAIAREFPHQNIYYARN